VALDGLAEGPPGPVRPDVVLSGAGLARPGEAPRPAAEFLAAEFGGRDPAVRAREQALRKLLRLPEAGARTFAVRFGGPEGLDLEVARLPR